jgi:protein SCO1/2
MSALTPTRILGLLLSLLLISLFWRESRKRSGTFEVYAPPARSDLARHWQVPDFCLTERSGGTVSLSGLKGKVWVADFFYTSCPGPCPMMTSRLSEIHKATRGRDGVVMVSISTDPSKDTPEVLKQYAEKFGADQRWLFLTGDKDAIFNLANKGFKLSVTEEGGTEAEPVTHSTKLVLVDKNGTIRGFYEGTSKDDIQQIESAISRLEKETR